MTLRSSHSPVTPILTNPLKKASNFDWFFIHIRPATRQQVIGGMGPPGKGGLVMVALALCGQIDGAAAFAQVRLDAMYSPSLCRSTSCCDALLRSHFCSHSLDDAEPPFGSREKERASEPERGREGGSERESQ